MIKPVISIMKMKTSGILTVTKDREWLVMDFPAQPPVPCDMPKAMAAAFDVAPIECLKSEDYIAVFERERDVEIANPDFGQLMKLDLRGVIITARSSRSVSSVSVIRTRSGAQFRRGCI